MADHSLRIAMAQLNVWVGDITGNTRQILEAAHTARDRDHADIVVVPELVPPLAPTSLPGEAQILKLGSDVPSVSPLNFGGFVLGCIDADLTNESVIGEASPRSLFHPGIYSNSILQISKRFLETD